MSVEQNPSNRPQRDRNAEHIFATVHDLNPFFDRELLLWEQSNAIRVISEFDPTLIRPRDLQRFGRTMYAEREKELPKPHKPEMGGDGTIDLRDERQVPFVTHHVLVHAITGLPELGTSLTDNIPVWDRDTLRAALEHHYPRLARELLELVDVVSINIIRSGLTVFVDEAKRFKDAAEFTQESLNNQRTHNDKTQELTGELERTSASRDRYITYTKAKLKHLAWLTDIQPNPEIRRLLSPEIVGYYQALRRLGVPERDFDIHTAFDTRLKPVGDEASYKIDMFKQLGHLDQETIEAQPTPEVITFRELYNNINREGFTPSIFELPEYKLPWDFES